MAALHLVIEEFNEDPKSDIDQQAFVILRDFLQPDSKMSLGSVSTSLLALLPDKQPESWEILLLGEVFVELAEQIPYFHPSQLKLARLLQQMARSPKVTTVKLEKNTYFPFRRLSETFRDNLQTPDSENLSKYINFHSFVAKVELHVWETSCPTWAIWEMRAAFEQDKKFYPSSSVRDTYVLAAAQYVLFKGQDLIQQIVYPGDISDLDYQHWAPGPRYSGSANLDRMRWHFWRNGFAAEAQKGAALDEVRAVAGKTAKMMDLLEETAFGLP